MNSLLLQTDSVSSNIRQSGLRHCLLIKIIPENYPAWTAVEVEGLVMPQLMVEIKAIAVIGSGKNG